MLAYRTLETVFARIQAIEDAAGILGWDAQSLMPSGAAEGRADQLATLRALAHESLVSASTAELVATASDDRQALDTWQAANLREMRRRYAHAAAVPADLVVASSRATSRAEMAWRDARARSDFAMLAPHLEEVLRLQREIGQAKGTALGLSTYDALLDQFDPGLRQATIDPIFDRLRTELPTLIADAQAAQARRPAPLPLEGPFPVAAQRALGESLMQMVGFDFGRGRLDTSLHPFCGGATSDVRITTRYDEADATRALMGMLHETGHALYEQGRPADWLRQPVSSARGMLMHESQSLLIEMQACRTRAFLSALAPRLRDAFGRESPAYEPENLYCLYTRVAPGFIRVDADEVTYPAHILLRYDLERAFVSGDLAVADLPAAFDEGLHKLLGLRVLDDARGCLQDMHGPSGAWGYFPTYTLGAIAAAQLYSAARAQTPDIEDRLADGDFAPLVAWLRREVHAKGSLLETNELLSEATGSPLTLEPYLAHLRRRYVED